MSSTKTILFLSLEFGCIFSLVILSRTARTIVNKTSKSDHPCLVLYVTKSDCISPLNMLTIGLDYVAVHSSYNFLEIFYHKKYNFVKCFFCLYWDDINFILYSSNMMCHIFCLYMVNTLHFGAKSSLLMGYGLWSINKRWGSVCWYFLNVLHVHSFFWYVHF